ncbi:MAG: class I SAM-dependent methyltransferase [Chitinophagaceae bacterium]|nr:class I SAM-dependent methyltransferase [Chitinophagaceae bacterium]
MQIFNDSRSLTGIDLNELEQFNVLKKGVSFLPDFPFYNGTNLRYKLPNNFFGRGDALSLFLIFMQYSPKRVVEIGSGYSSAAMMDYNELFFNSSIYLDFIEPYPERLKSLLTKDSANITIHQQFVQDIPLQFFDKLEANDILFIDSSHVSKIGSDVNYLFFEVLPRLKKGVLVHIHDISYPFEYSKDWVDYGIYWNEAYLLRAFLSFNNTFQIILWNDFLRKRKSAEIKAIHSNYENIGGGSIWLKKL